MKCSQFPCTCVFSHKTSHAYFDFSRHQPMPFVFSKVSWKLVYVLWRVKDVHSRNLHCLTLTNDVCLYCILSYAVSITTDIPWQDTFDFRSSCLLQLDDNPIVITGLCFLKRTTPLTNASNFTISFWLKFMFSCSMFDKHENASILLTIYCHKSF